MEPVYVPTNPHEKAMQRALIQYRDPKNYALVREALEKAGRQDLIGFGKECLIRPYPPKKDAGKPGGKQEARKTAGKGPSRKGGKPSQKGTPSQHRGRPGKVSSRESRSRKKR